MTKRLRAVEEGLEPHYKIRVVLPGAVLHLAARNTPSRQLLVGEGVVWDADWITDPDYGDTIGFIDWDAVIGITWRWSE